MANWYIVSSSNNTLAVQGGATSGSGVTLEVFDPNNPLQQWAADLQVADTYGGVALVNPSTGLSITYNGNNEQLVMQSYSPSSTDQDAWLLAQAGGPDLLRITYPKDQGWSWNDRGGQFQPGDQIALWNDTHPNSVWSLIYQ